MRAGLYVRLSKEDKEGRASGVDSIAVQKHDGTEAIRSQGWDFDPKRHIFIDDDVSGRSTKRDGWSEMIAAASQGEFQILVMRDLDRFARYEPARQMGALMDLFDRGVRVWTCKDRNFVKLAGAESIVTYAKAIASEAYVEAIRTNSINAINRRALDGRAIKQPGLGYTIEDQGTKGKRWVIVPEEAATVLHIGRTFVACKSVNATAKLLNDEGIPAPWGSQWRANGVTKLLNRSLYRGFYQHGDVAIPHPELRIWPHDMEAQIVALLAKPLKPWSNTPRHLSTPFVRCGLCGGVIAATKSGRSACWSLTCDRSRMRACEGIGYRKEGTVDQALLGALGALITDEVWGRTKEILLAALEAQKQTDTRDAEIDRLRREVQGAERKVRNHTEAIGEADTKEERAPILAKLREESKRLEALRAALRAAEAAPATEGPKSILEAAEARVMALRETLARGGVEARPAVEVIMGDEKFRADREGNGWVLTAKVGTAGLFVELFTGPSSYGQNHEHFAGAFEPVELRAVA